MSLVKRSVERIDSTSRIPFRDGVMKDRIVTNSFTTQPKKMYVSMLGHVV